MAFSLGSGGKAVQKEAHTQTVICTMRITLRRPVLSERSSCPEYGSYQQIIPDVKVILRYQVQLQQRVMVWVVH